MMMNTKVILGNMLLLCLPLLFFLSFFFRWVILYCKSFLGVIYVMLCFDLSQKQQLS